MRLYVGGFPEEVQKTDLQQLFGKFKDAGVQQIEVMPNKLTPGTSRGFGYVTFRDDAAAAVQKIITAYNGSKWKGGRLKLEVAAPNYLERLALERSQPTPVEQEEDDPAVELEPTTETERIPVKQLNTVKIGVGDKGNKAYLILPLQPVEVRSYEELRSSAKKKKSSKRPRQGSVQVSTETPKRLRHFTSVKVEPVRTLHWDIDAPDQEESEEQREDTEIVPELRSRLDSKERAEEENGVDLDLAKVEFTWNSAEVAAGAETGSDDNESSGEEEGGEEEGEEEEEEQTKHQTKVTNGHAAFPMENVEDQESSDEDKHILNAAPETLEQDEGVSTRKESSMSVEAEEGEDVKADQEGDDDDLRKLFEDEKNRSLGVLASLFPDDAEKDAASSSHAHTETDPAHREAKLKRDFFKRPTQEGGLSSLNSQFQRYDPTADNSATFEVETKKAEGDKVEEEEEQEEREEEALAEAAKDVAFETKEAEWTTEEAELKTIFGRFRVTEGEKKTVEEKKKEAKQIESFSLAALFAFNESPADDAMDTDQVDSTVQKLLDAETMIEDTDGQTRSEVAPQKGEEEALNASGSTMKEEEEQVAYDVDTLASNFRRTVTAEVLEQQWLEKRRALTLDFKRKHKQAIKARRGMKPPRQQLVDGPAA